MKPARTPEEAAYNAADAALNEAVIAALHVLMDKQGPTHLAVELITRLLRTGDHVRAAHLMDALRTMENAWEAVLDSETNVTRGDEP